MLARLMTMKTLPYLTGETTHSWQYARQRWPTLLEPGQILQRATLRAFGMLSDTLQNMIPTRVAALTQPITKRTRQRAFTAGHSTVTLHLGKRLTLRKAAVPSIIGVMARLAGTYALAWPIMNTRLIKCF